MHRLGAFRQLHSSAFLPDIDYDWPLQGFGNSPVMFEVEVPDWFEAGEGQHRPAPLYACNPRHRYYCSIT